MRAHGYHKGMSGQWQPRDIPRQDHVKTKTVVIIGPTGKRRKETVQI